ncbi:hypothetical protein ACJZ2D_000953 [Fusarium nematophilum]
MIPSALRQRDAILLELIQNAEDNTYDCATPSLSFTYKRGSLRVDCNEIGFSDSNVRAICKIGESTKAGLGRSARYIGEKGIGFKSVFKVASVDEKTLLVSRGSKDAVTLDSDDYGGEIPTTRNHAQRLRRPASVSPLYQGISGENQLITKATGATSEAGIMTDVPPPPPQSKDPARRRSTPTSPSMATYGPIAAIPEKMAQTLHDIEVRASASEMMPSLGPTLHHQQ